MYPNNYNYKKEVNKISQDINTSFKFKNILYYCILEYFKYKFCIKIVLKEKNTRYQ